MIVSAPCGAMEGLEFRGLCQFRGIPTRNRLPVKTQFLMGKDDNLPGLDVSPAHESLARKMHDAFIRFIKTGTPEAEGLPSWPLYTTDKKQMMIFDEICRTVTAPEPGTPEDMPFQVFRLTE